MAKLKTQYEYKNGRGYTDIPAQTAGEELERISDLHGTLTASCVVDESRDADAPLHGAFEWDDGIAAEKHREQQARVLIGSLVSVRVGDVASNEPVRVYVHIQNEYRQLDTVVTNKDYKEELLQKALAELQSFQRKYRLLSELAEVNAIIEQTQIRYAQMQIQTETRPSA